MKIVIPKKKLKAALEDEVACKRRYGTKMARKIALRLDALSAAESLHDFWPPNSGPERCHVLKGDHNGTFSMDLEHPYRLLFTSEGTVERNPTSDEKARWESITAIEILGIEDTH